MKALVLGGTGFIGRRLVDHLLKENCDVTLGTSGRSPNPFGDAVNAVAVDRFSVSSLEEKLSSPPYFDVLFDQICFGPDDAEKIIEVFGSRIGRYVFVSSGAVYDKTPDNEISENAFDPYNYVTQQGGIENLGYSEGKRSAESHLFHNAPFPVAAARFPIVVGYDDSTLRFQKLVEDVMEGNKIYIPGNGKKRNYLWVDDAGRFLYWLGSKDKVGPYNAASGYRIDAVHLVELVGEVLGVSPEIVAEKGSAHITPFYAVEEKILVPDKAETEGFSFTAFKDWIRNEIELAAGEKRKSPNSVDYFTRRLPGK